jgi:serine/threonine-protein kinase
MGLTPRPMSTSARPVTVPPPSKAPIAIAIIAAVVLAGAAVLGITFVRSKGPAGTTTATTATGEVKPADPGRVEAASFSLALESSPSGATVMEGDQVLGTTPMTVNIERSSVTSSSRTFVLKKDGYVSGSVVQGPSDANVKSAVALAPEPTATVKSSPPKPGGIKVQPPPPVKPPPGPSDIRLNR